MPDISDRRALCQGEDFHGKNAAEASQFRIRLLTLLIAQPEALHRRSELGF